ncbi:hypothetical protein PHJA_002863200 [Phtheirospermum japonicum]|uniref:Uncharacterized protein n=1 Tax=Phtheirospermum japonicum TaxID=374723 RepID=A0A830D530_9LAMI|nr:hypothetical protein PHJA_002863200 [Phtheirospermum japonicum]
MGNAIIAPCFRPGNPRSSAVKLISYGGGASILTGKHLAGEIMFEFPDRMVCHADSFFIGRPIPSLSIQDELVAGQTYFLLPLDCSGAVLSPSSLATLGPGPDKRRAGGFKGCPFEYMKGSDGRVLIKVVPEFISRLISKEVMVNNGDGESCGDTGSNSPLCSTPELQKHYNQLVGCKDRTNWSPKLETISEYKIRFSPCRFMGLEWKKQEIEG